MKKIGLYLLKTLIGLGITASSLMFGLGGVLLHIFTVSTIYHEFGTVWAVVAFAFVFVSELYLLFHAASVNPLGWGNQYTYYVLWWAVSGIVLFGLFFIWEKYFDEQDYSSLEYDYEKTQKELAAIDAKLESYVIESQSKN